MNDDDNDNEENKIKVTYNRKVKPNNQTGHKNVYIYTDTHIHTHTHTNVGTFHNQMNGTQYDRREIISVQINIFFSKKTHKNKQCTLNQLSSIIQ